MASDRVTRSGRTNPRPNKPARRSKSSHVHLASMDLDSPDNTPKLTTSRLNPKFDPKEIFNTEDEFTSSDEKNSNHSRQSIEEQKTPKPPKKAKGNTPPNPTIETSDEEINDLPPPLFDQNLGHWQNSEKFDQHPSNTKRTNQIYTSGIGNSHQANRNTGTNTHAGTDQGTLGGTKQGTIGGI